MGGQLCIEMRHGPFASESRRTRELSFMHNPTKSRLRCENATRWSSTYLMFETFIKAFKKDVFNNEYKCPYSQADIEFYFKILQPAYLFSVVVQRSTSSIGDILPLLCTMIISLERFILTENAAQFRDNLLTNIKMKFTEELNSTIYLTSEFLCTSKLVIS